MYCMTKPSGTLVPEGSFILVSCTNFASDPFLCARCRIVGDPDKQALERGLVSCMAGLWVLGLVYFLCFSGLER